MGKLVGLGLLRENSFSELLLKITGLLVMMEWDSKQMKKTWQKALKCPRTRSLAMKYQQSSFES